MEILAIHEYVRLILGYLIDTANTNIIKQHVIK